jgi:hypothetical protein
MGRSYDYYELYNMPERYMYRLNHAEETAGLRRSNSGMGIAGGMGSASGSAPASPSGSPKHFSSGAAAAESSRDPRRRQSNYLTGSGLSKVAPAAAAAVGAGATRSASPAGRPSADLNNGGSNSEAAYADRGQQLRLSELSHDGGQRSRQHSSSQPDAYIHPDQGGKYHTDSNSSSNDKRTNGHHDRASGASSHNSMPKNYFGYISRDPSPSVGGGGRDSAKVSIRLLAEEGIRRYRSRSASRRQQEEEAYNRRNFVPKDKDAAYVFIVYFILFYLFSYHGTIF